MMRAWNILGILFLAHHMISQELPNRYVSEVFPVISETFEVEFSTQVPQPRKGGGFYEWFTGFPLNVDESDLQMVNLYMDIFQPVGDTLAQRPVVILCFGGGFLDGSKDHWSIRKIAQKLARRGFVTATMDYRLGMNIFDEFLSMRAVYRGVQDGRSAVRFFRADAAGSDTYKIDPNQIYIGGHSSGGFIALHNLYMDKDAERPPSTRAWYHNGWLLNQGGLDSVGNNTQFDGRANAAFSLAGGLGFTSYIEGGEKEEVVLFHSTDDNTVPYNYGQPFSGLLWAVIGDDLPDVYGSNLIAQRMANVSLPYDFNSYTSRGHDVHEANSSNLHYDILPEISDWFHGEYLEPLGSQILQDGFVCDASKVYHYEVDMQDASYIDWEITNGQFSSPDTTGSKVSVLWNDNQLNHQLSATPYGVHLARGQASELPVALLQGQTKLWMGASGLWSTTSDWSNNSLPEACDQVIIPNSGQVINIEVDGSHTIQSLITGDQVNLLLNTNAWLSIRKD